MIEFAFHPEAERDLDDIWEFVAEGSFSAADKVSERIIAALHALVATPHMGHRRADLTSRPLRFWRVYDYLIAYAPDEHPLWVVAIMHGHRSPRVMAAILRGREQPPNN